MKAIEFKEHNMVFAKDQKEYAPLPAHGQNNGMITFCMELNTKEIKAIKASERVRITVLNFNQPVQPMRLWADKPEIPVPFDVSLNASPIQWDKESGTATFEFIFSANEVISIRKNKEIWITTSTHGSPLQPISNLLKS